MENYLLFLNRFKDLEFVEEIMLENLSYDAFQAIESFCSQEITDKGAQSVIQAPMLIGYLFCSHVKKVEMLNKLYCDSK